MDIDYLNRPFDCNDPKNLNKGLETVPDQFKGMLTCSWISSYFKDYADNELVIGKEIEINRGIYKIIKRVQDENYPGLHWITCEPIKLNNLRKRIWIEYQGEISRKFFVGLMRDIKKLGVL